MTIQVVDGDATVDDATEVELTVSGGAASVVLAAQGSGTIQVAVSTEGASSQIITIEAPGLGEGAVGPIALDADLASGDQEDRVLPGSFAVGDQVVVDVVAVSGANGIIGFQVQLVYDPLALSFVDFLPTDLMAAGLPLPREESESVEDLLIRVDDLFGQFRDFENIISPSPPSPARITRNTDILFADESPADVSELKPGVLVAVEGTEIVFPGAPEGERVAEFVSIIGGEQFQIDGLVESVDETEGTITLESRPSEFINSRAFFGDFNGQGISPEEFRDLLESREDVEVVVEFNPFGPGIVRLSLLDPAFPRPIHPEEEIFDRFFVRIEETGDGFSLAFNPLPPFTLGDGIEVFDENGDPVDLGSLPGQLIFMEGELVGDQPIVFYAETFRDLEEVFVEVEIGDFDGEGDENDAVLNVFDIDGNEIDTDIVVFLDFLPPAVVRSGAVARNLGPGLHRVEVEVPSLGLFAEREFAIRARGSSFTVVSTEPEDGAVGVPESGEVRITFSAPVQRSGRFINVEAFLHPGFEGRPLGGLRLEDDGRTVVIPVELQANTSYTLSLVGAFGANDQALTEPLTLTFSTGDELASFGSIEGTLELVEAASKQADPVEILFGEVIAINEDGEFSGESAVDEQGGFQVPGLREGTYKLFAKVETTAGTTSGAYDPDGDNEPDGVDVGPGEAAVLADFTVPLPLVRTEVDLVADDAVTVDFNVANGDDGVTETTVPPGESFEIAVYAKGIVDLLGYEIQVDYDSNAVTLDGVTEDGELESNILKRNGGIAVSLSAPRGDAISFSTVLLGPADSQLGQGDGLLAVLTFLVNDRFSGATDVVVTKVQFSNGVGGVEEVETFTRGTVNVEGLERQITLASSADTISADGVATATLTAALFDLDGLALTDDGLVITFDVVSGDARINGGSALAPSSSNGGASAILTILSEGDVVARATVAGAREATVTVVGSGLPALGEGTVGPMAIDLDTEDGDQGVRVLETVPDDGVVTVDLVAISGASGLAGYQFTLLFDATALEAGTFTPSGLFSGALPLPSEGDGLIRGSVAFLGSTKTTEDAGSIGTVTFTVKEGATLPTRVTLSAGQFAASADDQTRLTIGAGGATVQIGGDASGEPTPDFDGDGTVGFGDFIQFAQAFGASTGAANFDAKFDLVSCPGNRFTYLFYF